MGKSTYSAANCPDVDVKYMRRALQLARCGRLTACPNPMVGAVIVARGRIIGEGFHVRPGEGHAEVNAVSSVKSVDMHLLHEAVMYVTLEPCSHYGRTPPCAELIIKCGIPRVVVGCIDPFGAVKGRGVAMLRDAGVEVVTGVLEEECLWLNRRFVTFHSLQRPYVTLKWARSSDGFIDRIRTDGSAVRISTEATRQHVHRQRSLNQAILVGHRTWELDRPSLDVRFWFGSPPSRCVLGDFGSERLPADVLALPDIDAMLAELHQRGVQTLLVEGGRETLQSFIDRGLWDEAWEECAALELGEGVPAPSMPREADMRQDIWGVPFNRWFSAKRFCASVK